MNVFASTALIVCLVPLAFFRLFVGEGREANAQAGSEVVNVAAGDEEPTRLYGVLCWQLTADTTLGVACPGANDCAGQTCKVRQWSYGIGGNWYACGCSTFDKEQFAPLGGKECYKHRRVYPGDPPFDGCTVTTCPDLRECKNLGLGQRCECK